MGRPPNSSRQTRAVLAALAGMPHRWWYGYDLGKAVALKSGTLYPILIRLHEQGLLEAEWRQPEAPGRPARHMYRLTSAGAALAREVAKQSEEPVPARGRLRPAS